MAEYAVNTLSRDTYPYEKTISLDPTSKKKTQNIVIANASGRTLTPGTLVQKIPLNTLEATVAAAGVNGTATSVPVANNTGTIEVGTIIRINDELMEVSAYADDALTVTRGAWGSTAGAHVEDDVISIVSIGDTATQKYKPWDGLEPIEGYVYENIDATSTDQNTYMIFDDIVNRDLMSAANDDIPIPLGLDKNSMLNFVEVE